MRQKIWIWTIVLLVTAPALLAQVVVKKSNERIRIDGILYYVHTVKNGETVYSLAKAYNVTQEDLLKKNPGHPEGLKAGERLIIPISSEDSQVAGKAHTIAEAPESSPTVQKHVVRQRETLYSIARQYQVTLKELMDFNYLPDTGIKMGMELLIPNREVIKPEQLTGTPVKNNPSPQQGTVSPRYHKVTGNETLESIAHTYNVSEEALINSNRDIFNRGKLMKGMLMEIPSSDIRNSLVLETVDYLLTDHNVDCEAEKIRAKGQTYKVALLLPLAAYIPVFQDTSVIDSTGLVSTPVEHLNTNHSYVEFYEGALLALKDMKEQGLRVELSVFDILSEDDHVTHLINRNALSGFDLIIGPIHAQDFIPMAEYAQQQHIHIVSPLDSKTESLTVLNPYIFQVSPPVSHQYAKLVKDINHTHDRNVLLLSEKSISQQDLLLEGEFFDALKQQTDSITRIVYHEETGKRLPQFIRPYLSVSGDNRIVIASNNEVFVTEVLAFLHQLVVLRKYQITVYGTSRWRNFESIDLTYFHELNLRIAVPFFVDYNMLHTKNFVTNYRASYNAEPSQFAFQGYDVFSYFMQALMQYGRHFENCIATFAPSPLLQSNYRFYRNNGQGGFLNRESTRISYTSSFTIERD